MWKGHDLDVPKSAHYNIVMEKLLTTVPAHFDGKEIRLDAPITLKPNARLLITILEPVSDEHDKLVQAAMLSSEQAFARVWDNDEDAAYDDL